MYIWWELFLEGNRSYFKFLKNSNILTSLTHEFAYVAWGIKGEDYKDAEKVEREDSISLPFPPPFLGVRPRKGPSKEREDSISLVPPPFPPPPFPPHLF